LGARVNLVAAAQPRNQVAVSIWRESPRRETWFRCAATRFVRRGVGQPWLGEGPPERLLGLNSVSLVTDSGGAV